MILDVFGDDFLVVVFGFIVVDLIIFVDVLVIFNKYNIFELVVVIEYFKVVKEEIFKFGDLCFVCVIIIVIVIV